MITSKLERGTMSKMSERMRHIAVCGLAAVLLVLSASAAQAEGRLHVLMVCDTVDETIGNDVKLDRDNLRTVLYGGFEAAGNQQRITWTVLEGEQATPEQILSYYENLPSTAEDSILFYYSGHGIIFNDTHFFGLNAGVLSRSLLRGAINSKPHALALIVSDCCASYPETTRAVALPSDRPAQWDVIEKLFFTPGALIDVNAASPGEYSWSNPEIGGFFSSAFTHALTMSAAEIGQREALSWNSLIATVGRLVDNTYRPEQAQRPYFFYRNEQPPQWYEKTLVVTNNFEAAINVRVRYLTMTDQGQFEWFTPNLYWTIQPGESITLQDPPPEGFLIRGAAMNIWAESTDGKWAWGGEGEDPFLMIDDRFGYAAPQREAFTYTFE